MESSISMKLCRDKEKLPFMFWMKTCSCFSKRVHYFGEGQVFSETLIFCFSNASFSAFFLSNSSCLRFSSRAWLNILRKFSKVVITRGKRGMALSCAHMIIRNALVWSVKLCTYDHTKCFVQFVPMKNSKLKNFKRLNHKARHRRKCEAQLFWIITYQTLPCSNGQRAGSSPKYRINVSTFLPCWYVHKKNIPLGTSQCGKTPNDHKNSVRIRPTTPE